MSINNPGNQNQTAMGSALQSAGLQTGAPVRQESQPRQAPTVTNTLFRGNGSLWTGLSRNNTSEALSGLSASLSKNLEESLKKPFGARVFTIESQASELAFDLIVVAAGLTDKNDQFVRAGFHTLIIEATTSPFAAREFTVPGGRKYELFVSSGDGYDGKVIDTVHAELARQLPGVELIDGDATVVPRDLDLKDPDVIRRLSWQAVTAAVTRLGTNTEGYKGTSIAGEDFANSRLQVSTSLNTSITAPQRQDVLLQPIRSDIQIELAAVKNNQPGQSNVNASLHQPSKKKALTNLSGFVDLVYQPDRPVDNPFAPRPQVQSGTNHLYTPRIVVTQAESQEDLTLHKQLLGLVSLQALFDSGKYLQALVSRHYHSEVQDIRDIGAINIEANFGGTPGQLGSRLDTSAADFSEEQLVQFVTAFIRQTPIISIDVAEVGPDAWYNGVIAAAAQGDEGANDLIWLAAQELTEGRLEKYVNRGERLFINESNRIHLGYYLGKDGDKRDIRDLGYLEILNIWGERDYSLVRKYSDTHTRLDYPLEQRLAERELIIRQSRAGVTFTGYAQRCTAQPKLINGLFRSIVEGGLPFSVSDLSQNFEGQQRAAYQFGGAFTMNQGAGELYNRSNGGFTGTQGQGFNLGRRFNY